MGSDTLQQVIGRLLAERPELWETFRVDPEGALRDAGVALSDAEWVELRRLSQASSAGLRPPERDPARDMGARLRAELEEERASHSLDHNPLAEELQSGEPEPRGPSALDEERHQVESEAERLRAALAAEKKRVEAERARMKRALGKS